jgi:hypothetical protein
MKKNIIRIVAMLTFALIFGVTVTSAQITMVDFEDDTQVGSNIVWNPDFGLTPADVKAHRAWLNSKGIDITGAPNGFVWSTKHSGPIGVTGVVIGFASPNHLEQDEGLSDNEQLAVDFLGAQLKSVEVELTVVPSDVSIINNVPATVIMEAYDSAGNQVATATKTFTGVTNSVHTPAKLSISVAEFRIAKVTLRASQHPYGGVWLEAVTYDKQPVVINVAIDIKPGSFPNSINPGSGGNVPVAILGSPTFDVTTVNPYSISLAGATVNLKGKTQTPHASYEDVNGDGFMDLIVQVSTDALELSGNDIEATLTGMTYDGIPISGKDSVRNVPQV